MIKPVIAITMGGAAGIGPEIVVKTLSEETVWEDCSPVVVGDLSVMTDICRVIGAEMQFKEIKKSV